MKIKELLSAKTMTPEQLAKLHGVNVSVINAQVKKGTKEELEHTKSKVVAREIALDHIKEYPDYYDRLEKIEK